MIRLVFIWLISFCGVALADTATEQLASRLSPIHSMQADFKQAVYDKDGQALQQSEGRFELLRPGRLRWQTLTPEQQLIVIQKQSVWIYDPDLLQATKQQLHSERQPLATLLLNANVDDILKRFVVTVQGKTVYILQPTDKQTTLSEIRLNFADKQLRGMQFKDKLGQTTMISFSKIQTNLTLNNKLFQFTPPPGTDVIVN